MVCMNSVRFIASGRVWTIHSGCVYVCLQAFINSSFENISSTQHALSLLAQFKAILLRESLREELDSKVQVRHTECCTHRLSLPALHPSEHMPFL